MRARFSIPLMCMECGDVFDADVYTEAHTASDTLLHALSDAIKSTISSHDKHSCKGPVNS